MNVKKAVPFLMSVVLLWSAQGVFAQTIEDVNQSAGFAYLQKAAEACSNQDWERALVQAELGEAYLPSYADFHYIQAKALTELQKPRGDSLAHAYGAMDKGLKWRIFGTEEAALLCVRLLVETRQYEQSLQMLKRVSALSADKDYYRAAALYGLGRRQEAQGVIFTSLQRYPFDARFTKLFFMQERGRKANARTKNLARRLLSRIYVWQESHPELLVLSTPFEENTDEIIRRLKMYRSYLELPNAKVDFFTRSYAIVLALNFGIISERSALDEFLTAVNPKAHLLSVRHTKNVTIYRSHLEDLCRLIKDETLQAELLKFIDSFSGILYYDDNKDGIINARTKFYQGRPLLSEFDPDQDGYPDFIVNADFGTPSKITGKKKSYELVYDDYPSVKRLKKKDVLYTFRPLALRWHPIKNVPLKLDLADENGKKLSFFTLALGRQSEFPSDGELLKSAVYFEHPKAHVENSRVRVYIDGGVPLSAETTIDGHPYAFAEYRGGVIVSQRIDRDGDGYFEMRESYTKKGRLQKIHIDVNKNNIFEYYEEYFANKTVKKFWDSNENGRYEIAHVQFPNGNAITQWIHPKTKKRVEVQYKSGIPRVLISNKKRLSILKDNKEPVYWLNNIPDFAGGIAAQLMSLFEKKQYAVSSCFVTIENKKIFAVRSGGFIFAEIIGASAR